MVKMINHLNQGSFFLFYDRLNLRYVLTLCAQIIWWEREGKKVMWFEKQYYNLIYINKK